MFERLASGNRAIVVDEELLKLNRFAGTPLLIQVVAARQPSLSQFHAIDEVEATVHADGEAHWFAGTFALLGLVNISWKVDQEHLINEVPWASRGVTVWSRRAEHANFDESVRLDPYTMHLDTPERKALGSAEALTRYLKSDLGLETATHAPLDDKDGNVENPDFAKLSLSADTVVVTIGLSNLEEDLRLRRQRIDEELQERLLFGSP